MPGPRPKSRRPSSARSRPSSPALADALLAQRALVTDRDAPLPTIVVKAPIRHPFLYRKRLGKFDPQAGLGDLVQVVLPDGAVFGHGWFNPRAEIAVRMLNFDSARPDADWWQQRLTAAARLRTEVLGVPRDASAYRLLHAEADGVPGLVVDRYGDVLSAETFSLGAYQRAQDLMGRLAELTGCRSWVVATGPATLSQEGFVAPPLGTPDAPNEVIIKEFGTRFVVRFEDGHKTGFFCDQRDNRRRFAALCAGKSVLDLCCYTGGFSIQAKQLGQAAEVTGVDLDEHAIELARRNVKLNRSDVRFVHADVFPYMRDMLRNGRQFDAVVLDPPKLIHTRSEIEEGARKYFDLNRLAMQLVAPGGVLLSCSCSGLMDGERFGHTLRKATHAAGRSGRMLWRSAAAADHPVALDCPETDYLKAVCLTLE